MVSMMYACPRCGQRKAVEVDPTGPGQVPEVTCPVCGTTMKPVSRACGCGKEIR